MAIGHLPIGSSSRRVPQTGAAVPRTGNVPGPDLEAPPQEGRPGGGGGQTCESRSRIQEQSRDLGVECNSTLSAPEVPPVTQSQEMSQKAGNARSALLHRPASPPTTVLFIKLQVRWLNYVALRTRGFVASSE